MYMKRSTIFTVIGVLVLIGVGGYFLYGVGGEPVGPYESVDAETAESLATEYAAESGEIDFEPESVSSARIDNDHFPDTHFLYVWGPLGHSQNVLVAVTDTGLVFGLPAEFNDFVATQNINLDDEADVLKYLEFYLQFYIALPGSDRQQIIEHVLDIPGVESGESTASLTSRIQPLEITSAGAVWELDFYSWRPINGAVFHWQLMVADDGSVEIQHMNTIAEDIGDSLRVE